MFFKQQLGPSDFTNKGPRRFPAADLGGLTEDVRCNKLLDLFTMSRQYNNQYNRNYWATHHGKGHRGNIKANGFSW